MHTSTHTCTQAHAHTCTLAVVTPLSSSRDAGPSGAPEPVRSRKEHGRAGGRKHRRQACWGREAGGWQEGHGGERGAQEPRLPDSCLCDSATLSKIRSPRAKKQSSCMQKGDRVTFPEDFQKIQRAQEELLAYVTILPLRKSPQETTPNTHTQTAFTLCLNTVIRQLSPNLGPTCPPLPSTQKTQPWNQPSSAPSHVTRFSMPSTSPLNHKHHSCWSPGSHAVP